MKKIVTGKSSKLSTIVLSTRLRAGIIDLFARILNTDEVHEALRAYSSRTGANIPHSLANITNIPNPYEQRVCKDHASSTRTRSDVIFLTGRFRSGSTALWNVFRHIKGCQAFYEPFNERRFFDRGARGNTTDPTHLGVDDYWLEYDDTEGLDELYNEEWVHRNLYMSETFWSPSMAHFIESLIAQSKERPVLQFNRVDLRLPWLRRQFPNASILHLYRNPRDQWCSFLMNIEEFPSDAPLSHFRDRFYLRAWARDLQHAFPFLANARQQHPYRLFYYIWKLSWLFGTQFAHRSVAYEDLINNPRKELSSLVEWLGVDADIETLQKLLVKRAPEGWKRYAEPIWFERHEQACEKVLYDFFDSNNSEKHNSLVTKLR